MKRIGEDVAEKLDYVPGVFTVERHIRGKWVCSDKACGGCQRIVQAPVAPHIIDKGIPTTALLAHVLVSKYLDHLPLYRQEAIYGRAGYPIPRSTLGAWVGACGVQLQPIVDAMRTELLEQSVLHADETPVAMLKPANQSNGKTHRAYLWSYCTSSFTQPQIVVFDFALSRGGHHARNFLGVGHPEGWRGTLVCDDYGGYKACFDQADIVEAGCMAHARRKFHELWVNHQSPVGEAALKFFAELYKIERDVQTATPPERQRIRQEPEPTHRRRAAPVVHHPARQDPRRLDHRQGHRLQPEALGCAHALHQEWPHPDRQQLGREPDPSDRHRPQELALRRQLACGPARCRCHEPDPLGAPEWAGPSRLPRRHLAAAAHPAQQPHSRDHAAVLET